MERPFHAMGLPAKSASAPMIGCKHRFAPWSSKAPGTTQHEQVVEAARDARGFESSGRRLVNQYGARTMLGWPPSPRELRQCLPEGVIAPSAGSAGPYCTATGGVPAGTLPRMKCALMHPPSVVSGGAQAAGDGGCGGALALAPGSQEASM